MPLDRKSLIRQVIEQAVPAEEYFAELEQRSPTANVNGKDYQAHLDALTKEYDALAGKEYLNANEAKSVRALLSYVAHKHNMKEQTVCAIVEAFFHVSEIRKLPRQDYEAVIKYLVDFELVTLH